MIDSIIRHLASFLDQWNVGITEQTPPTINKVKEDSSKQRKQQLRILIRIRVSNIRLFRWNYPETDDANLKSTLWTFKW